MTKARALALPNFDDTFSLEMNVSGLGMGAILIQHDHLIYFSSKQFCPRKLTASTYVRELCDITSSVKKWHTYLLGNTFTIYTDTSDPKT